LRGRRRRKGVENLGIPEFRLRALPVNACRTSGIYLGDATFRFLNTEIKLGQSEADLDWAPPSANRLWQFNLHYFDFLREAERPLRNKESLIQAWILAHPIESYTSLEPFTCSLRIVNWVLFLIETDRQEISQECLASLFAQTAWLEKNLEKDILANHYFENLKALFFASCVFKGPLARRWRSKSISELSAQLREQCLPDGGHYERSPQYHCLMVENYLDIYNMAIGYSAIVPDDFMSTVKCFAVRGLDWIADVHFPDGSIPLFNDSAFAVAPAVESLFRYAEDLFGYLPPARRPGCNIVERDESGLYGCAVGDDMILIDCGEIGPSYQPGHMHCDFLSYELMFSKKRVIVDSGVFEYEDGEMRAYVRSTAAHNTVSVDGAEQSEVWGAFRVGRRALKLDAKIGEIRNGVQFSGQFRGFPTVSGAIQHGRSAKIQLSDDQTMIRRILIEDRIEGRGLHTVESFIHVHPELEAVDLRNGTVELLCHQTPIAVIKIPDAQGYVVDAAFYCPEFGVRIQNPLIVIRREGELPMTLSYEVLNSVTR
jgi:uncharacterized heparinase superfamily protein